MKAGYRKKKKARVSIGKRMRLLMAAVLTMQMALSPVMAGTVSYAMEDISMEEAGGKNGEAADRENGQKAYSVSSNDVQSVSEGDAGQDSGQEDEAKLLYVKEAEDAELTNGARVSDAENASGGKMVGYIGTDGGSHADGSVTFKFTGVSAGSYELRVYYAVDSDNDRYFDIYVNGELKETQNKLPGTGSFTTPSVTPHSVTVELEDGANTVSFGCAEWYAPNLDKIEIYGVGDAFQDDTGKEDPDKPQD